MAISDNGSCPVCDVFGPLHLGRICCTNNGLENELCTRNPAVNQMKSPPNKQAILNARMENEQGIRIEREEEVVGGLRQRDQRGPPC